jgi:large conductance mechanosensitive channel
MSGFKKFLLRGNVVDLAVAVVIGVAFGAVVTAVVTDLITPLIGIPGKADFSALTFVVNGSVFHYGAVINTIISFATVAAVIYFVVVRPMAKREERRSAGTALDDVTRPCPECLSDILKAAKRCAFCTSVV